MWTRRGFAVGAGLTLAGLGLGLAARPALAAPPDPAALAAALAKIEAQSGGRLGVACLDATTGALAGLRERETFPMCSTFKILAAGAVLTQADAGQAQLSQIVRFGEADLVTYSPITKPRAGGEGMTLAELCAAALDYSDNTAANLLLRQIGGPAGVTRFARTLGDTATRLDRTETSLNEATPGDPRDTTTPAAMAGNLAKLALGDALAPASRAQLVAWMKANTTGDKRLRAGLPRDWAVGDKTGSGDHGSTNDVAVVWPTGRAPLVIAAYLTQTEASPDARSATLAAVGRAVAEAWGG